jgi:ABC-type enterobactin transport system permease subunit
MAEALRDRRFVSYLVVTNVVLVALAVAGPIWFVSGLAALAAVEVAQTLRSDARQPVRVRSRRR